jgi:2-polyprenyl-3-methyl-5-hydroxy-6-metoxy-1,4-benzoquinol methylase
LATGLINLCWQGESQGRRRTSINQRVVIPSYRERLYKSYVSSHFGALRNPTRESLAEAFPYFRQHFSNQLPSDHSVSILDLGCGYGTLLHWLRSEGYRHSVGIDVSAEQVEVATSLGIDGVVESDIASFLQNAKERFDVIFALDVIEHLYKDDLLEVLDLIVASLKPHGRLILRTPNADGPFAGRYRYWDFTHELAFTAPSIRQVLTVAGFSRVSVHPVQPAVHGLKSGVRWLLWRAFRAILITYLAVETGVTRGHILSQNLIAVARK